MTSRRKRNSPPNKIEAARNARIQSTIEAHRQALKRLAEGRKIAISLRKATDEMIKRSKLEMAGKAEHWKEIASELSAIKRERMQALRAWVKEIEEDTSLPLASVERQNQMWAEIRERQERERQESLQHQEKAAALENSADMAATENKQVMLIAVFCHQEQGKVRATLAMTLTLTLFIWHCITVVVFPKDNAINLWKTFLVSFPP